MRVWTKKECRSHFRQERGKLSDESIAEKSEKICELFFSNFNNESFRWLHVFLPMPLQKEVDTWPIVKRWFEMGKDRLVIVPKVEENNLMGNYVLSRTLETENDKMGIPTPKNSEKFNMNPDLVLVPLIACDYQGNRVGYGKGYYDQFLSELQHVPKIGLSFFKPVESISDIGLWDVPLDFCVTPEKVYNFNLY